MNRFLLTLICLLGLTVPCIGQETKVDAQFGVRYTQERVVSLPQDQHKPYLTIFGNPNDQKFADVQGWFKTNQTLKAFKDQTHFNVIPTNSVEFRQSYASNTPSQLVVRLQSLDVEKPIVELTGSQVPMSAEALAKHLNTQSMNAECFRRHRHNNVAPAPGPNGDPEPQPLPPPGPAPKPQPKGVGFGAILLGVGLTLLAALGGGFLGVRREYLNSQLA